MHWRQTKLQKMIFRRKPFYSKKTCTFCITLPYRVEIILARSLPRALNCSPKDWAAAVYYERASSVGLLRYHALRIQSLYSSFQSVSSTSTSATKDFHVRSLVVASWKNVTAWKIWSKWRIFYASQLCVDAHRVVFLRMKLENHFA